MGLVGADMERPEADIGLVGEGVGLAGEGVGLAGEGVGLAGEGVGLAGEGAGLAGEGAGLPGEGTGLAGEGAVLVRIGMGRIGEGAGISFRRCCFEFLVSLYTLIAKGFFTLPTLRFCSDVLCVLPFLTGITHSHFSHLCVNNRFFQFKVKRYVLNHSFF